MKQAKQKAPEAQVPARVVELGGIIFEYYPDRMVARTYSGHLEAEENPNSNGRELLLRVRPARQQDRT